MKIYTKTFLYTLVLLLLITFLANGLIYVLMPKMYIDHKNEELIRETDRFVEQLVKVGREEITQLMSDYSEELQANLYIDIGENSYKMITWSGGYIKEEISANVTSVNGESSVNVMVVDGENSDGATDGFNSYTFSKPSPMDGDMAVKTIEIHRDFLMDGEEGTLTATTTLAPVDEAVNIIISLLPISILMCLIAAIIFSLIYARLISNPIKAISEVTQRMTMLDKEVKCPITTKDEIGILATNVNGLYENLLTTIESLEKEIHHVSNAERAKTDFLRAASHELKTPVTAIGLIMDNMILGVGKYKDHEVWLPKCKALLDRLSSMLREILVASKLEEQLEASETVSIEDLCNKILEPYIMIAKAKGLELHIDWNKAFMITVPQKKITKVLSNVLSNAIEYTPYKGRIALYCNENELCIENECIPLKMDQLERIYEPFYRPDPARDANTGGSGLGLYITDTVLRSLNINYTFEPMISPEGMRFTIYF